MKIEVELRDIEALKEKIKELTNENIELKKHVLTEDELEKICRKHIDAGLQFAFNKIAKGLGFDQKEPYTHGIEYRFCRKWWDEKIDVKVEPNAMFIEGIKNAYLQITQLSI